MDPITVAGLAASIVQLINVTAGLVRYVNAVKDAPKDRARLAVECANLINFLVRFRYAIDDVDLEDPTFANIQLLAGDGGPLVQLTKAVDGLSRKLNPVTHTARVMRSMLWPLQKNDVDDLLSQIERLKSLISLHQQGDHFRLSLQIRTEVSALRNGVLRNYEDRELEMIANWISDLNFSKRQADYLARCQSGTGQWFLDGAIFNDWLDGPPRLLWCHGQPGAGKTLLSALAIEHIGRNASDHTGIAYIYFNYKEQESLTIERLVACLLRQFVLQSGADGVTAATYRRYSPKHVRPTLDELLQLLDIQTARFSRIFVVVDALDECSEDDIKDALLNQLLQLRSKVHVLITSRLMPPIEIEFSDGLATEIRAPDADIRRYLGIRLQGENRLARVLAGNSDLQAAVTDTIVANVQGMFLLAKLQMDSIAKKNNKRDVRKALLSLPQELNDTYDEAMQRISNQAQDDVDLAVRLLQWLVYAKRPLSLAEAQHALAVEEGEADLDEEGLPDEDIMISVCAGLVTVDKKSGIIRLVHYTAQEYFERTMGVHFPRTQTMITAACLSYLSFEPLAVHDNLAVGLYAITERYPLSRYAVEFWGEHARGNPETDIADSIISFLTDEAKVASWYRILRFSRMPLDQALSRTTGLHVGAWFGLSETIRLLLSHGAKLNARNTIGDTPLHEAAAQNREAALAELLRQPDCEVNVFNGRGRTPLLTAVGPGYVGVVRRLLQRSDIDADAPSQYGCFSPLWLAAQQGHAAIVQLLLSHTPAVDVNHVCAGGFNQTPLWCAAASGYAAVVELLLQRVDVDVNAADSVYGETPLHRAAAEGFVSVVELLLKHPHIQVNAVDSSYGDTALQKATQNGHDAVVEKLREHPDIDLLCMEKSAQLYTSSDDDDWGYPIDPIEEG